jgi:Bacterial PH domain
MVLGSALDLPRAVLFAGIGLMIFAVVLAVVALVLTARLRTTLVLDPESITIINGRRRHVVPWSTIDIVRRQGPRLLLITKPEGDGGGSDATVVNPRAETDATFSALIAEIQKRLNADRGYRQIS